MHSWRNPLLLITGIGVSYLGNWIYLIALNLSILNLTGSAAAVAGIYIIRPLAMLVTNTWSGSLIDRVNKRKLMIMIDVIRGALVFCIPFIGSLWIIYGFLFLISLVSALFGPSSTIYITKLVPTEKRTHFNSIMSMTNSGAFLIGPAISGVLIMYFGTDICIIINAITFWLCAYFIFLLPNVDEDLTRVQESVKRWKVILNDWKIVKGFVIQAKYFIAVYLLFQGAMLIDFALDSQEVTFIKHHLGVSDQKYGLITSLTGLGALAGGSVAALVAKKIHLKLFLGGGMLLTSVGYVMFYASSSFLTATLSFVFLGFFMSFANAGYATFFQNNVPVEMMGRFGSIADMTQGLIQICLTLILGLTTEMFSLQTFCLLFAIVGALLALGLFILVMIPSKAEAFKEKQAI